MNLLIGGASSGANQQNSIAQLLANLATGQGSTLSQIQIGQGNAQAAGTIGAADKAGSSVMAIAEMIAKAYGASDERLKDNIVKIYDGYVNLYLWTWKNISQIPEKMRGKVSYGVIAQEVSKAHPEIVNEHNGYLGVNYSELSEIVMRADHVQ